MQQIWKNQFEQNSTRLLFRSDIYNMAFVLFLHQQHGFWFLPTSTIWLSKMTRAGKTRRGCMNPQMPGSHQSSLKKSRNWMTQCSDWQGKAMIGLGSDKLMEKISYSIGDQAGKITFLAPWPTWTTLFLIFSTSTTLFLFSSGINNIWFVLFCHQHTGLLFCYSFNNMAVKINNS